jgi:spermidine/putrescine transport system permease protein
VSGHGSKLGTRAVGVLVPPAAWLTLLFLGPLGVIALISLMMPGAPVEWMIDGSAYQRLLDPIYLGVLWRSLSLAVMATVLCLVLGYPLAYYIARRPPRFRRVLFFLVLVPLWTNSLVLIYGWMVMLRPNGAFDQLLQGLGFGGGEPLTILYTPAAVILGLVYWYLPFMVYPLYASIEKLDFRLLEAARDLGAGGLAVLVRVLLPLTLPGIATGCLLVFVEALGAFVVPDLLGGAKSMMLGNLVQQRFLSVPQDWPMGAAAAMLMLALLLVGMLWASRVGGLRRGA